MRGRGERIVFWEKPCQGDSSIWEEDAVFEIYSLGKRVVEAGGPTGVEGHITVQFRRVELREFDRKE